MNPKAKLLAAAIAIFLAGGVVGGVAGINYGKRFINAVPDQAEIAQHIRSHLKDRAGLSEAQLLKIDPIIKNTAAQLETEHEDTTRKVWFIFTDFHAAISGPAELTSEQKNKLAKIEREHLSRLKTPPAP